MKWIAAFGIAIAALSASCIAEPPQAQIQNKQLHIKLYLPDAKDGFYTGTRFDWSGVIADLEFAGHHLYRPWFSSVDPSVRDFTYKDDAIIAAPNSAMTGPVEEFQTPIGYDTAKPGDTFLKVGVGLLKKADDTPYSFAKHFDLVDGGKWTTHTTPSSITFEQVLGGADSQYGYIYTKTLRVDGDSNRLIIEHHLKTVGKIAISTRIYDHNFLTIDGLPVGSAYSITVPYTIQPTRQPDSKFVTTEGSTARYIADLQGQDRVAFGLQGFSTDVKDYRFQIANSTAKVQLTITGDRPLVNASVWSIRSVLAVEPFIEIQADPGKEAAWSYTYTYSTL